MGSDNFFYKLHKGQNGSTEFFLKFYIGPTLISWNNLGHAKLFIMNIKSKITPEIFIQII